MTERRCPAVSAQGARGRIDPKRGGFSSIERARPLRNTTARSKPHAVLARGEQGRLCVGVRTDHPPFHPFVPVVIRAFRAAFPLVSLTLDECLGKEALERLRDEQMDVAFLRAPVRTGELVVNPLLVEPMVVALPSDHALARSDRAGEAVSLRDLADQTLLSTRVSSGPRFMRRRWRPASRRGFSPRLGQEAPRITSALSLVAVELGSHWFRRACSV